MRIAAAFALGVVLTLAAQAAALATKPIVLLIACESGNVFPSPMSVATGQGCVATSNFGGRQTKRTAESITVYSNSESP